MRMEEATFENKRIANERKKIKFFKARGNFKYHFTQNIKQQKLICIMQWRKLIASS